MADNTSGVNRRWPGVIGVALAAALSAGAISASEGKAMIVTQNGRTAQCISPITINEIDGELTSVSPQGFELEPGHHTLHGQAEINIANCPVVRGSPHYEVKALEADFEAGKTYYVGLDHSSKNANEWKVVIWNVK